MPDETKSEIPEIQVAPERVFAFVDRNNLDRTTKDLLGFAIDWEKLSQHLRTERTEGRSWMCEKVFIYTGVRELDVVGLTAKHTKQGYEARIRTSFPQRDKVREHPYICTGCGIDGKLVVTSPGAIKSNCDVDLTVDAMQCIDGATEFLIFSGDGDFEALIRHSMEHGIRVRIVSNTRRDTNGEKKFSTRLQDLIADEIASGKNRASFIDINDWRKSIEKI